MCSRDISADVFHGFISVHMRDKTCPRSTLTCYDDGLEEECGLSTDEEQQHQQFTTSLYRTVLIYRRHI